MRIVVFDAKPYDIEFFEKWNKKYGAKITYFKEKLTLNNVMLTKYQDVVCTFVNDDLNEKVINILSKNGVRAIAIRAAGYNNVDIRHTITELGYLEYLHILHIQLLNIRLRY